MQGMMQRWKANGLLLVLLTPMRLLFLWCAVLTIAGQRHLLLARHIKFWRRTFPRPMLPEQLPSWIATASIRRSRQQCFS
ncbi:hypothetical protein TSA6c_22560 [Azospirillum sp. TSA6c]|nr:hypothetical protein TSA6c_22560 [Azospirillum sp. TSA6c]